MHKRHILATVAVLVCSVAWADVVVLNSGGELRGRIVSETATEVVLEVGGGHIRLARSRIAEIKREGEDDYTMAEAERQLSEGEVDQAIVLYRRAVARGVAGADKKLIAAELQAGQFAISAGELKAAREHLLAAGRLADGKYPSSTLLVTAGMDQVEAASKRGEELVRQARSALDSGDAARARTGYQMAVSTDQSLVARVAGARAVAAARLAHTHANGGDHALGLSLLQEALSLDPTLAPQLRDSVQRLHVAVAAQWAGRGQQAKAKSVLNKALKLDSDALLVHLYLGVLAEAEGRSQVALRHYRLALGGKAPATVQDARRACESRYSPLPVPPESFGGIAENLAVSGDLELQVTRGKIAVYAANRSEALKVAVAGVRAQAAIQSWAGRADGKVEIHLFSDQAAFTKAGGESAHRLGMTRLVRDNKGRVLSRQIMTFEGAPGLLERIIPHEMTHAYVGGGSTAALPLWLEEGLASLAEPQAEIDQRLRQVAQRTGRGPGLDLARVVNMSEYPRGHEDNATFYAVSTAFAEFLGTRRGGKRRLLELGRRHGQEAEVMLERGYSYRTLVAAERDFVTWLKRRR